MNNKLMRDVLVDFLRTQIVKDDKVMVLDADLAKCSGIIALQKEYPSRVVNVGIQEQNMISVAAGLSAYGFVPFVHSFAPFVTRRVLDQVMISVCYAKQNVKIVGTDPGIAAELNGGTHMPFEDIAALRAIPNMVIYEPTDNWEFLSALPQILAHDGPVYVRMLRKLPPPIYSEGYQFNLFAANVLQEGRDVTLVASGLMVATAMEAAKKLNEQGILAEVVVSPTIKPLDKTTIVASAQKTGAVVTCENHSVIGGLYSAVCETLAAACPVPVQAVGVKEQFGEVGKMDYLRKVFHLESDDIVKMALAAIAAKK